MKFYIKQSTEPDALFTVMDSLGQLIYRVTGDSLSLGSKIYLVDQNKNEVARIFSVGLTSISKYSVFIGDKERARIMQNLNATRQPIKIKGISWRFRGDLVSRSYDIINVDSSVVMSHGRCWNASGECYGIDVANESDVLLCLCLSVILDSIVIVGSTAAVPAN